MEKLEKRPFAEVLLGPRIRLVQSGPEYTQQVFDYIQRDRRLGGVNYSWVITLDDVAKSITMAPNDDFKEIDYLILKESKVIGSFHIHSISYLDFKADLGYGIEKGEEGNGFVSEALQL